MNNKLKQEYNRLRIASRDLCVRVCAADYGSETELLDSVAMLLEKDIRFIQLEQGKCADGVFLEVSKKVSQLTSMYDATLVLRGSLAVSYFVEPDGVILSDGDLGICEAKELLGEERVIGYCSGDKESVKKAIKRGVDYITTPSISTDEVVIEYAKWVFENIDLPVFIEVDSANAYAALAAANIAKFIITTNLLDSILHTHFK